MDSVEPLIFVKPSFFLTMAGKEKSPVLHDFRVFAQRLR
jgi:hypothetical protein